MRAAAEVGFITATDLADWLVRVLGLPFREAHHVTGRIVKLAEDRAASSPNSASPISSRSSRASPQAVFDVLTVDASVASRTSFGGTAPETVRAAVASARERFL